MSRFLFCFIGLIYFPSTRSIGDTYKAGVADTSIFRAATAGTEPYANIQKHLQIIEDASKQNVDILVLPFISLTYGYDPDEHRSLDYAFPTPHSDDTPCDSNQYPKEISHISCAAKDAHLYVAVGVLEQKYCNNNLEIFNTHIVFDRNGKIIKRYSEAISGNTNCTVTETNRTLETDFGVTFAILTDSDLIYMKNHETFLQSDIKNYILYADSATYEKITMTNFPSAWVYVHKVNVLVLELSDKVPGCTGVYSTKEFKTVDSRSRLLTMNIQKGAYAGIPITIPSLQRIHGTTLEHSEDLNPYSVEFLPTALTDDGHRAALCQSGFCCDFYLKTNGQCDDRLALAVFNGVRALGTAAVGLHTCRVMRCDDIVGDKCTTRLPNRSGLVFESIRISGNFSEHTSQQYPEIVMDVSSLDEDQFTFDSYSYEDQRHTSVQLTEARHVVRFGIVSRDFSRDDNEVDNLKSNMSNSSKGILDQSYLDKNRIVDFFDSLWITIRIPVFIVSIYVLEQI